MADSIYVINVGGYIGSSTRSEIEYAKANGKEVRYMENAAMLTVASSLSLEETTVGSLAKICKRREFSQPLQNSPQH